MKHSLTCPRCAAVRIWNVREVMEHSRQGPAPLGAPQGLSPLEAFICAGCGYTEWYSASPRSLQPEPSASVVELSDHRLLCRLCESREHLLVARFEEAEALAAPPGLGINARPAWVVPLAVLRERRVPSGTFAVVICRDCGVLSWFACDLPPLPLIVERGCARCAAPALGRVQRVEEIGGHVLPVAFGDQKEVGQFHLDICTTCGFTDWFGERTRRLREDGRKVLLLEGGNASLRTPPPKPGPYR